VTATVPPSPPRHATGFDFLAEAATATAALTAAEHLGVLDRLDRGPANAAALVTDCGLTCRAAPLLLEVLAAAGAATPVGNGSYRAVRGIRRLGELLRLTATGLPDLLRTGVPPVSADTRSGAEQLYTGTTDHLGSLMADAAALVADHLASAAVPAAVLDVGAGAAPWSLALAHRLPHCRFTALDLPAVLATTRTAVETAGHTTRFTFLDADMFTADLPAAAYDLVIVGNLCHLFDPSTNRHLLARLTHTLRPSGTLAILDILPDSRGTDRRWLALYALGLHARTTSGQVHPYAAYQQWLTEAPLTSLRRIDLPTTPPLTLLTAHHPPDRETLS
jgi:ubiquinone/menaquinone biosynthesis C-methylase UbiE